MQPHAAPAVGLDHAAVGQHVEADRLAHVRRRGDEVHLVVGQHGGAAVAVGDAGRPLDRPAEMGAQVAGVEAGRRVAEGGVERATALIVLAPRDRVVEPHRAAGVRRLVDGGQHVGDAADVAGEVVPLVGAVPVAAAGVSDAGWTRSATLMVAALTAEAPLARVPRMSVRKDQSGSVSMAEWMPTNPPPSR